MSDALEFKIKEQGDKVRKLKAEKATKDQVKICAVSWLKASGPPFLEIRNLIYSQEKYYTPY